MSNYPLPPTPPGPFGTNFGDYANPTPGPDALGPARRASVMLWILGGLGIMCGLCIAGSVWMVPADKIIERLQATMTAEQRSQMQNVDLVKVIRIGATFVCVVEVIFAGVMLATAAYVRRGSRAAIGTAMVPCALALLWCVGLCLFNIGAMAVRAAPVTSVVDVLVWALVGLAMAVTLYWLIRAMGAAKRLAQQQFFQAQYWHYQQQQQQPTGYGYGAQPGGPPPPAPQNWMNLPPPPPAAPPPPPPSGGSSAQ